MNPMRMPLADAPGLVQTARMKRFLPILLLAMLLSACGFHLRGAMTLPVDIGPIEIVSRDPYSPLATSLAAALERQGAFTEVVSRPSNQLATLVLSTERWRSTPISVDLRGRSQEQTLAHAVIFSLRNAEGELLVPDQAIELTRDYVSSPTESIGTTSEREILTEELRREMVVAILRRIDAVLKSTEPAPTTTQGP